MNRIKTKLGKYLLLFCFLYSSLTTYGQARIQIEGLDSVFVQQWSDSSYLEMSADSFAAIVLSELLEQSYLAASIDSIQIIDGVAHLYIFQGPKINWAYPVLDSLTKAQLKRADLLPADGPMKSTDLLNWRSEIISGFANSGYPFASFQLTDIWMSGDTLRSRLDFEKGPLIVIGKVENEFDIGISPAILGNLIGIPQGSVFDFSAIQNLSQTLKNLSYLEQTREARLSFEDGEAVVTLFLKQKKSSSMNLLLGLIPSGGVPGARLTLTGLADINTQNMLGKGELLSFKFERLLAQTQTVDLNISFPYIFNLPFGVEAEMHQNRRDSSFNIVEGQLGLSSYFRGSNRISLFYGWEQSNLLSFNQDQLIASKVLPNTLDTRARNYGLNIDYSKVDYVLNPRKGIQLNTKITLSQKRIVPNNVISALSDPEQPDFDFAQLYADSLVDNRLLFKQELELATYLPLSKRLIFKNGLRGAFLYAGRDILRNEQWILGGNSNLRGFNEGLLFADAYLVETLEFRYILERNTYLFAFSDLARLWSGKSFTDYLGLGLGLSFEVQSGIFGISLAVGKEDELPFDFSSPKVHFGFINQF